MAASQPPELIEQILDELNGDLPSLRACALLHPSWVPASQDRLFHTVSVDRVEKWNSLVQLLQTRPHIRALIRRLEWAIPRAGKRSVAIAEPSPTLFPRVEHLVFKHGPLRDALLYGLPSLVTVELCEWDKNRKFSVDPALAKRISSKLSSEYGGSLAVANLMVVGVTRIQALSLAEWIQVCVRRKTLRTLAISIPRLVDGPSHREMFGTLGSLEELVLSVQSDLGGSELALGVLPISKLHLIVYPDAESVPFICGILRQSSFPALRRLHITLEALQDHRARNTEGQLRFDPLPTYVADDPSPQLEAWMLPASLTEVLESVIVELKGITEFCHTSAFLALFGSGNRPDVLRVTSGGAQLLE